MATPADEGIFDNGCEGKLVQKFPEDSLIVKSLYKYGNGSQDAERPGPEV